ncbi:D-sedoheptulose 7-phosphate isomerase [Sinosporangium album]|uniref:D-sedoheptulose 7-phosphate isomerase n=1 Tax=Sinosporangium album TaxID=504805 RepID=A0A1G8HIK9_9ACTN|nr:SIS domain-containing protein [Sinosporangium album]SDI06498.1 D-sedoheptulose 7-phosphate isomerase [Sinosporangium album]
MSVPMETMESAAIEAFARRERAGNALAADADKVAHACLDMASRFHRGGKLITFGNGQSGTDAAHIAVEFMHPVIIGKRALPAMAVSNDPASITGVAAREGYDEVFAYQVSQWAGPDDIALGISPDGQCADVLRGLEVAGEFGLLTVALTGSYGGMIAESPAVAHSLIAQSSDPAVVKEIHVTIYHLLWELCHVFLEQPALLGPEVIR